MKFFEKVKNMFTEEVEDEVKVEKIKKEVTHVPIESPNTKEDNFEEEVVENFKFEDTQKLNTPVFFDDNDFKDLNIIEPKEEPKKEVVEEKRVIKQKEFYSGNSPLKYEEEKKVFKPTPIISPVYGVLDKNYHKEDIVERNDTDNRSYKEETEPSIDSIRNKAYGTLEDELENTLFGKNSILFKDEEDNKKDTTLSDKDSDLNDDLLSDLTDDIGKELDEILIKKEKHTSDVDLDDEKEEVEEKESNKKDNELDEDDFLDFIDSTLYKDGDDK